MKSKFYMSLLALLLSNYLFAQKRENFTYLKTIDGMLLNCIIDGIDGSNPKIKKGIKYGYVEQVVTYDYHKFLDKTNFIPDFNNCIKDTDVLVKKLLKSKSLNSFYVLCGNYFNGKKNGEFDLLYYKKEGSTKSQNGNTYYSEYKCIPAYKLSFKNDTLILVNNFPALLYNQNSWEKFYPDRDVYELYETKIAFDLESKTATSSNKDYFIFKSNEIDSAYLKNANLQFKRGEKSNEYVINQNYYRSTNYTYLNIISDNPPIQNSYYLHGDKYKTHYNNTYKIFEELDLSRCILTGIKKVSAGYIAFEFKNGNPNGKLICYDEDKKSIICLNLNDTSLQLYANTFNKKDKLISFHELNIYFDLYSLVKEDNNFSIFNDNDYCKIDLSTLPSGHYLVANIPNLVLEYNKEYNSFSLNLPKTVKQKPYSINYQINEKVVRTEIIKDNDFEYVNFDWNGSVTASTKKDMEKDAIYQQQLNQSTQDLAYRIYGKPDDIVECGWCGKKIINKNSIALIEAKCSGLIIPTFKYDAFGLPNGCLHVCSEACSHKIQCKMCADHKTPRLNCN